MLSKLDSKCLEYLIPLLEFVECKLDDFLCNVDDNLESISNIIDVIDIVIKEFSDSKGIKHTKFFIILRLAFFGKSGGLGIAHSIFILGLFESKKRAMLFLESNVKN